VQLFLLFFGLPQFDILLPAFLCGVLGLGIYSGAYVSEIVRGTIQSIDRGQGDAHHHFAAGNRAHDSAAG
jgi:polar amino acid transport system permease protein